MHWGELEMLCLSIELKRRVTRLIPAHAVSSAQHHNIPRFHSPLR
jgi:hypothetical protein